MHRIIAEGLAYDEDARGQFAEAMEWPEVQGEVFVEKQDQSARHAANLIGGDSPDEMFMRVWNARQRQAAMAAATTETQESVPPAPPDLISIGGDDE